MRAKIALINPKILNVKIPASVSGSGRLISTVRHALDATRDARVVALWSAPSRLDENRSILFF